MIQKTSMTAALPPAVLAQLHALQLPREALAYIDRCQIPSTTPNGTKSYTVRYPCPLTAEVIVLSSRDIELAFLLTLLCDPNVSYFIAQPSVLELELDNPRQRFYQES